MIAAALLPALFAVQQPPRYEESIDVSIVNVDVVVTDRQGNHVHGLKAEDFIVDEGRDRRAITNFSEYAAATAAENPTTIAPRRIERSSSLRTS